MDALLSEGKTRNDTEFVNLKTEFFDYIEERTNVRGHEDIENFIDGYSDNFHALYNRLLES